MSCLRKSNGVACNAPHGHCNDQVNAQAAARQDGNGTCTCEYGYLRKDCPGACGGTAQDICTFMTGGGGVCNSAVNGTDPCTSNTAGFRASPDGPEPMESYWGTHCSGRCHKCSNRGDRTWGHNAHGTCPCDQYTSYPDGSKGRPGGMYNPAAATAPVMTDFSDLDSAPGNLDDTPHLGELYRCRV